MAPKIFREGPQILGLDYGIEQTSHHVAKFQADRPTKLKKKKK